jgi:hypothetical protein
MFVLRLIKYLFISFLRSCHQASVQKLPQKDSETFFRLGEVSHNGVGTGTQKRNKQILEYNHLNK